MSGAFETAVVDSTKLLKKPGNEELLDLYGLYKIATGENFKTATAPTMFDLRGKAKYNAWKKFHEEGVTKEEARTRYVSLVETLKEKYGYNADKNPEAVGSS